MTRAQPDCHRTMLLKLTGALNTRDIGGYRTVDGREIIRGRLFRSSELSYLTDDDVRLLGEKGVTTVVDFRGPGEAADAPDRLPPGTLRVASPVIGDELDESAIRRFLQRDGLPDGMYDEARVSSYGPFYRMLTLVNSYDDPSYVERLVGYKPFFEQLLKQPAGEAMLFHCTGGRDRTGVATALLLHILGVPEGTIEKDYLASNTYLQPDADNPYSLEFERFRFSNVYVQPVTNRKLREVAASFGTTAEKISRSIALKPEYIRSLFRNIERQCGSIKDFLASRFGVDAKDIAALREKYTIPSGI